MYSPKIREDLIPLIHKAAKEAGISMTRWVNRAVEAALIAHWLSGSDETGRTSKRHSVDQSHPKETGGHDL